MNCAAVTARLLFFPLALAPACGGSPTMPPESPAPAPSLTEVTTSVHYVIHTSPGDVVDTAWQDAYYEWVIAALQIEPQGRLDYFKYRDRAHLGAVTGRNTNGFAEPGTTRFHTIFPTDNHEGVHTLVILLIGHPPALFNEGVAVAHQTDPVRGLLRPRWNGTDLDELARTYDARGQLPALSALLTSPDFFRFDTNITYPCSGSFVRYLIDRYGLSVFKTYLRSATFDDGAADTQSRFQAAYGRALASVWEDWRAHIR